jgi:hypothetical protein
MNNFESKVVYSFYQYQLKIIQLIDNNLKTFFLKIPQIICSIYFSKILSFDLHLHFLLEFLSFEKIIKFIQLKFTHKLMI